MKIGENETETIIRYLKENDSFSIFYHLDGDGITSAAIITRTLEKLGKTVNGLRPTNYEDFENGIDLSEFNQNLIICDMQVWEKVLPELKTKNLCIIDHHELIDHQGMTYINPKMWGDLRYTPCALVTYRALEKLSPELDWVSAIGLVSDSGGKENSAFLRAVAQKYNVNLKDDEYLYNNDFGVAASMLNSITLQNGRIGAEESLGILLSSNSLHELLNNQRLISVNNHVKAEVEKIKASFEHAKENYNDTIFFFDVDPRKKRYSSSVITPLSLDKMYYGKVLVFMTHINGDTLRINMRSNGLNIKLPDVLREVFKKIKGNGGGHNSAAGASIRPSDKDKFKSLFVEEIEKGIKKH